MVFLLTFLCERSTWEFVLRKCHVASCIRDISPSPASTQDMYGHEDDSSTESELAAEIKRVFSPMYSYERKRKWDEMKQE